MPGDGCSEKLALGGQFPDDIELNASWEVELGGPLARSQRVCTIPPSSCSIVEQKVCTLVLCTCSTVGYNFIVSYIFIDYLYL